ncbi:MAG: copper chaperone PCu(A)C [Rhodobacteraceae bacterium]|nr:copper chaperone PCu(A)C [Paracoccaceae bacterium]
MTRFQMLLAATAALFTLPAFAEGVHINDPYAITRGTIGATGAVFFIVENHADADDRLTAVASDVAEMVEMHTHSQNADGVMTMPAVPEGFPIAAGGELVLQRGGNHIMLMGLTRALKDGDVIELTLTFEHAGDVVVEVPVDNHHKAAAGGHDHAAHDMTKMVDTTGMTDADAVIAVMKAQFDTPENPLMVDPVVVEGDNALASWAQGDKGGRALLARRDGQWQIVLCGGEDLRMPGFLAENGVSAAETLSQMYNAAEDGLGADKVALYSSFQGVVMISPAP